MQNWKYWFPKAKYRKSVDILGRWGFVMYVYWCKKFPLFQRSNDRSCRFHPFWYTNVSVYLKSDVGLMPPFGLGTVSRFESKPWNLSSEGTGTTTSCNWNWHKAANISTCFWADVGRLWGRKHLSPMTSLMNLLYHGLSKGISHMQVQQTKFFKTKSCAQI